MCEFGWLFLVVSSRLSRLGWPLPMARDRPIDDSGNWPAHDQAKNDPERDRRERARRMWLLDWMLSFGCHL